MNKDDWRRVFKFYKKPQSDLHEEGIKWHNRFYTIYWWSDNYICEAIVDELTLPKIFIDVYRDIKQRIEEVEPQDISECWYKHRLFIPQKSVDYDFYQLNLEQVKTKIDNIYTHINNIDGFYYMNNMWEEYYLWIKVVEVKKREEESLLAVIKEACIQCFSSSVYPRKKVEELIEDLDFSLL